MGRPMKELTPVQKAEVETLAAVLSAAQVADYFGIGRTTFFSMMERDPEIAERYKRGKAKAIGAIAQGLIAKARGGDTTSMIFYLKTQAGWRETSAIEHVVEQTDPAEGTRASERLLARLDAIARRQAELQTIDALPVPAPAFPACADLVGQDVPVGQDASAPAPDRTLPSGNVPR